MSQNIPMKQNIPINQNIPIKPNQFSLTNDMILKYGSIISAAVFRFNYNRLFNISVYY